MRRFLWLFLPTVFLIARAAGDAPAVDVAAGWLRLFDGETAFGWSIDGEARVVGGVLVLGGTRTTTAVSPSLGGGEVQLRYRIEGKEAPMMSLGAGAARPADDARGQRQRFRLDNRKAAPIAKWTIPAGTQVHVTELAFRPTLTQSLLDGKTLTGWKSFTGDPKREKSTFTLADGVLTVKNGPGDLATETLFDDFVLQLQCRSNGKFLNSGIFFRAIPGQYQNGYEAQIQHDFSLPMPKSYPVDVYDQATGKATGKREVLSRARDFGTGAIYRRIPARSAQAKDGEWFTMTVVARGRHLTTWVNGVQQVDWTDHRPPHDNPRNGYREKAGAISIQGHDPTTDLSFKEFRISPLERN